MKDVVSNNSEAKGLGVAAMAPEAGLVASEPNETIGTGAVERLSLFCSLDGTCVNPHDAIPLDARDTFARNFMSHFAAALGESQHPA